MRAIELIRGLWTPQSGEDVRWVGQVERNSCAIACLAMLLGVDYAEARSRIPTFDPAVGTALSDVLRVLGENGWAYVEKWSDYSPAARPRPRWPLPPFAPVHICAVRTPGWHAVVMMRDGTVLDPLHPAPRRLDTYVDVLQITGLWRIP
jgi:hypothetical protein